jgi:hypothetical protein
MIPSLWTVNPFALAGLFRADRIERVAKFGYEDAKQPILDHYTKVLQVVDAVGTFAGFRKKHPRTNELCNAQPLVAQTGKPATE